MKLFRKCLILSHRYLGIALSLLIFMWFATGIVMMYTGGMPRISPQLRFERSPAVDMSRIQLTPAEAAKVAGLENDSLSDGLGHERNRQLRVTLVSILGRPVYRFSAGSRATVFADTGELLDQLSVEQCRTIASHFLNLPEQQVHYVQTLARVDQWTLAAGGARQMPLHKFAAADKDGTEVYIQPQTGEVAMLTTRRTRALSWLGVIPHWLYFTALRTNQPLWYRIVVWSSAAACVVAVLGLVLGLVLFRRPKPFRLSSAIPYSGWMRWHYVSGLVFGIFTLTWAFSGLLSMEPFAWTRATGLEVRRDVFTGGAPDLRQFRMMDSAQWSQILTGRAVKEIEFVRIQDEHYYVVRPSAASPSVEQRRERLHQPYNVAGAAEGERLLISARTLQIRHEPFSEESLVARLRHALPDVPVVEQAVLSDYDSYYYSRGRQLPLPVLRVKFGDPASTWFYIDPATSQLLSEVHRLNRVERWLYNGLHSLDFSFWYNRRPLWDAGMITLLLGGLISSGVGLFLGFKRLMRGAAPKHREKAERFENALLQR